MTNPFWYALYFVAAIIICSIVAIPYEFFKNAGKIMFKYLVAFICKSLFSVNPLLDKSKYEDIDL